MPCLGLVKYVRMDSEKQVNASGWRARVSVAEDSGLSHSYHWEKSPKRTEAQLLREKTRESRVETSSAYR
jgi:hypothetical protein